MDTTAAQADISELVSDFLPRVELGVRACAAARRYL
jgi:hypothetical protein